MMVTLSIQHQKDGGNVFEEKRGLGKRRRERTDGRLGNLLLGRYNEN